MSGEWTKNAPTVPGWYGYRDHDTSEFIWYDGTAYFDANGRISKSYLFLEGEWLGPLGAVK